MPHRSLVSRFRLRGHGGLAAIAFTSAISLSWVLWEVGFDAGALVARVVAPVVFLIYALLLGPLLRRRERQRGYQPSPVPTTAFAGVGVAIGLMLFAHYSTAQDLLPTEADVHIPPATSAAWATPAMRAGPMLAYARAGN